MIKIEFKKYEIKIKYKKFLELIEIIYVYILIQLLNFVNNNFTTKFDK